MTTAERHELDLLGNGNIDIRRTEGLRVLGERDQARRIAQRLCHWLLRFSAISGGQITDPEELRRLHEDLLLTEQADWLVAVAHLGGNER